MNERDPVGMLQTEVNRAFDDFLRMMPVPFAGLPRAFLVDGQAIRADVVEDDKEIRVTAELPGLDDRDIDIRIGDGMLTISGEKKIDREANEQGYVLRERSFGRIERTLPLPDGIDADRAQATFKNGVLTVTIPKTSPAQNDARRIPVSAQ
ncbi:MAG: Hsp20/alpha crystallin family protein [Bradyrhizobium sp.]|nr:Hsp20/alpha crystallin family protein [Bradyrhizobium sp.]